jgi:adenylate kinase
MKRRILLLGPPGSGKGTIAALLEKELGIAHLSSGHLLRQEVENGSSLGRRAKEFLEKGELVPDEMVLEVVWPWLESASAKGGFALDGFPRNLAQARDLDHRLLERGMPVEKALFFDGPEVELVKRLTGRRSCPACGRVYQHQSLPPKLPGFCDQCGIALVQRPDDEDAVVRKRYAIYRRETEPLAECYRRQAKLTVIDATLTIEQRFSASVEALTR